MSTLMTISLIRHRMSSPLDRLRKQLHDHETARPSSFDTLVLSSEKYDFRLEAMGVTGEEATEDEVTSIVDRRSCGYIIWLNWY